MFCGAEHHYSVELITTLQGGCAVKCLWALLCRSKVESAKVFSRRDKSGRFVMSLISTAFTTLIILCFYELDFSLSPFSYIWVQQFVYVLIGWQHKALSAVNNWSWLIREESRHSDRWLVNLSNTDADTKALLLLSSLSSFRDEWELKLVLCDLGVK